MEKHRIEGETALKAWIDQNEKEGLIINSYPRGFSRQYAILHRSTCKSFRDTGSSMTTYSKYCFPDVQKLIDALVKENLSLSDLKAGCPKCSVKRILPTHDREELAHRVDALLKKGPMERPVGNKKPLKTDVIGTSFIRDPSVVTWVRQRAQGKCELCGNDAPFMGKSGLPYLEVHHLVYLSQGGEDTVKNCAALCPNCHRAAHHSCEPQNIFDTLKDIIRTKH